VTLEMIEGLLFATIRTGTPLLLVGLGVLICEKSGVLNIGQEGLVLMGAACAFIGCHVSGNAWIGALAGAMAGALMGTLFAVLVLLLQTNQVATGLALTIFGSGLAAFLGGDYVGESIQGFTVLPIPFLSALPLLGGGLFSQDPLVYFSLVLLILVWYLTTRSYTGLVLKALGDNPQAAHQIGYPVILIRFAAVVTGAAFAGLAGAYLATAYTPLWTESISSGRGWIGLALVVFAGWRVIRLAAGAYLFGLASIAHLSLQTLGYELSPNLLATLPYLLTIIALVLMAHRSDGPPSSLGTPFRSG